jgi:hypothetical protein
VVGTALRTATVGTRDDTDFAYGILTPMEAQLDRDCIHLLLRSQTMKYVAFSVTWMTKGGHTLIFGARTLSCNSGIFSRPLTYTKTWHDTTREPQDFLPREDRAAQLETMGGDPLFLSDASDDNDDRLETPLTEDEGSAESILSPFVMAALALSVKSLFKRFVILRLGRSPMESPH